MKSPEAHSPRLEPSEEKVSPDKANGVTRRDILRYGAGLLTYLLLQQPQETGKVTQQAMDFPMPETKEPEKEVPKVSFRFFYAIHRTKEDVLGLEEEIGKAGVYVYVPETAGWTKQLAKDYTALSSGRMTPRELMVKHGLTDETHWQRELSALYNSKKLVLFVDIPRGKDAYRKYVEKRGFDLNISEDFGTAMRSMRGYLKNFADAIAFREQYIVDQLAKVKHDIEEGRYSELRGKQDVKALIFLGAAHTPVYHALKKSGTEVSRVFPRNPFVYGAPEVEVLRRFRFDKEVPDELVARALFSKYLSQLTSGWDETDTYKIWQYHQRVANLFSYREIESFFNEIPREIEASFDNLLARKLKEKNIPVSNGDSIFDDFIRHKEKPVQ